MLIKNDFTFLSSINKVMANYYTMLGMKMKREIIDENRYQQEINFISYLIGESMKFMPSTLTEFNRYILQDRLTSFVKKNSKEGNIPSKISITTTVDDHTYRGDYNILLFALKTYLKYYYQMDVYDNYSLVLSEKGDTSKDIIELVLLLKSDNDYVINDKIRVNTMETIFYNLFNAYRGSITVEVKDNEHLVLMRFPVQIVHERGERFE